MHKRNNKKNTGFTIIETMISVSIFIIIIMAGMGALLNANALHQKSQSMRSILDSMSFTMEDMSRNLRTGYHYRCYDGIFPWNQDYAQTPALNTPQSCANGWVLVFEEANGETPLTPAPNTDSNATDQWAYLIGSYNGKDGIFKSTKGGGTSEVPDWIKLTPDEVTIDVVASGFTVLGAEAPSTGDLQQPFVVIRLVGNIVYKDTNTPFSLQTSVSQRGIDR
ncbi:MAG: hypothetical protein UR90_C0007G0010 [Parcubacteria group bacterium GW2011_GWC1_35_8]|uniref:Type II secretion system protein n=2 Tax=Candidatus Nomuraibacteriota TaxID=1752729 RepID=A0A1F6YVE6_9BACT|nr:MAG: hypothetical protein UR90_C0007G0010 [Parcubacteria group bacterium GW2011_GWC1_35_8]KKP88546.1 MAG: hypothetical protein UR91_C0016G0009 [Candidatus Nomurabacteria bacterium GW2011_GWC2_35_8]OGJ06306.1 MAG: hypothetical protein A2238_00465 [Candidatus Nomurabacteria bacterium RIFOXYA2_FULL_35_9]OGJ10250.1 MAG: hypothetical protein A2456_03250 [Candidatus Nomurabacteria bacterium RIFOXYC2_FULL_36_19]OGJ14297.1 MAG: hypothetical protein A2554_00805 [Candidatus Nomurabacteria bacterium RI